MARGKRQSGAGIWIVLGSLAASGLILAGIAAVAYIDREAGPRYEVVIGPELKKTGATLSTWRRHDDGWGCVVKLPATAERSIRLRSLKVEAASGEGVKLAGSRSRGPEVKPGESGFLELTIDSPHAAKVTLDLP